MENLFILHWRVSVFHPRGRLGTVCSSLDLPQLVLVKGGQPGSHTKAWNSIFPGESQRQRSLTSSSPYDRQESDTTEVTYPACKRGVFEDLNIPVSRAAWLCPQFPFLFEESYPAVTLSQDRLSADWPGGRRGVLARRAWTWVLTAHRPRLS